MPGGREGGAPVIGLSVGSGPGSALFPPVGGFGGPQAGGGRVGVPSGIGHSFSTVVVSLGSAGASVGSIGGVSEGSMGCWSPSLTSF